jgi:hypothetical protein
MKILGHLVSRKPLTISERAMFDLEWKSSNFLPAIVTLVSSANIMGFDKVFIVGGRSFICTMKSKGPRIDPWGTHCYCSPV